MLNHRLNRNPITRPARVATTIAVVIVTVLLAGFSAAQTFVTFSGSVLDPTNRILPGVTLVLTNTRNQSNYEVRSDGTGHFEFVGLPAGDYAFEAKLAGFATLKGTMTVMGRNVQQDIALEVGSLEETITVVGRRGASSSPSPERRNVDELRRRNGLQACSANTSIGGNIKAPLKVGDARPQYPDYLKEAGVGGVVVLDAVIGNDGDVREVSVVNSVPSGP